MLVIILHYVADKAKLKANDHFVRLKKIVSKKLMIILQVLPELFPSGLRRRPAQAASPPSI
jgi:hypothetical protein